MTQPAASAPGALRLVLWGTCDTGKPRTRILLQGLRDNGVEVTECRTDVWGGIEDKSTVKGAGTWLALGLKVLFAYPRLLLRYLRLPRHDWVLLGYPAFIDVFVIWPFARLRGARIALDWFLSAYDTIVLDRALFAASHPVGRLARLGEWAGIRLADRPFMDTTAHARRMEALFGLAHGRVGRVLVGVEDAVFAPSPGPQALSTSSPRGLKVLFYGQFIPLHGIETIIRAAGLLRDAPVQWTVIGKGQEAARIRVLLDADPLPALRWLDWVDYTGLRDEIASADVCLGIFGTSDKAASVIPNKVFQVLAAGRPLITRDSPAIRELLAHAPPCVSLVPAGDPSALADAVLRLAEGHVAPAGPCHDAVRSAIVPRAVGAQLRELLVGTGSEGRSA